MIIIVKNYKSIIPLNFDGAFIKIWVDSPEF